MITCWQCAREFDILRFGLSCPICEYGEFPMSEFDKNGWNNELLLLRQAIRSHRAPMVVPLVPH